MTTFHHTFIIIQGGGLIVIYLNGQKGNEPGLLWVREVHDVSRRQERQALENRSRQS